MPFRTVVVFAYLEDHEVNYLMRVQKIFHPQIDTCPKDDFPFSFSKNGKDYETRVIKLPLPSGETEILVTNLTPQQVEISDFNALYFKRWPIETRYNTLKHKLKIEQFTGKTVVSIQQDFYATLYLSNIVTFFKMAANEEIQKQSDGKRRKYPYQMNESALISSLKDQLVRLLLLNSTQKRCHYLDKLIDKATKNCSPIRPGRHYPRPKDWHSARTKPKKKMRKEI